MSTQVNTTQAPENKVSHQNWQRPYYEIRENNDAFSIQVSLPGVNREGVDISLEDDFLTVTGARADHASEGWRPLRREIKQGNYRLSLRLNVPVNEANIKAQLANGILDLALPKADEVKSRKIQVT